MLFHFFLHFEESKLLKIKLKPTIRDDLKLKVVYDVVVNIDRMQITCLVSKFTKAMSKKVEKKAKLFYIKFNNKVILTNQEFTIYLSIYIKYGLLSP